MKYMVSRCPTCGGLPVAELNTVPVFAGLIENDDGGFDYSGNSKVDWNAQEAWLDMVYWKGEKFWLGKLMEHPEIMTQGETVEELEENIKDAYRSMVMDDVPEDFQVKQIVV